MHLTFIYIPSSHQSYYGGKPNDSQAFTIIQPAGHQKSCSPNFMRDYIQTIPASQQEAMPPHIIPRYILDIPIDGLLCRERPSIRM